MSTTIIQAHKVIHVQNEKVKLGEGGRDVARGNDMCSGVVGCGEGGGDGIKMRGYPQSLKISLPPFFLTHICDQLFEIE